MTSFHEIARHSSADLKVAYRLERRLRASRLWIATVTSNGCLTVETKAPSISCQPARWCGRLERTMLRRDLVSRVVKAHDSVVKAAALWGEVAAKRGNDEKLLMRYRNAENKFEAAMAALVDDGNRRR